MRMVPVNPAGYRICAATKRFDHWAELNSLIQGAFAYMDGMIEPPSSAKSLDLESLKEKAKSETLLLAYFQDSLAGCCFLRIECKFVYIGKMAVSHAHQRKGLGARFIELSEDIARANGCKILQLETRIELKDNHRVFEKLGFVKTGETAHEGFKRPTSITMEKHVC